MGNKTNSQIQFLPSVTHIQGSGEEDQGEAGREACHGDQASADHGIVPIQKSFFSYFITPMK